MEACPCNDKLLSITKHYSKHYLYEVALECRYMDSSVVARIQTERLHLIQAFYQLRCIYTVVDAVKWTLMRIDL